MNQKDNYIYCGLFRIRILLYTQLLLHKKTWKSARTASEPLLTQQILQFDISQKSCTIIEYADKIENNNPYYPPIYYMNSLFEIKSNQEHTDDIDDDDKIITMIRALFKSYKNSGYQR